MSESSSPSEKAPPSKLSSRGSTRREGSDSFSFSEVDRATIPTIIPASDPSSSFELLYEDLEELFSSGVVGGITSVQPSVLLNAWKFLRDRSHQRTIRKALRPVHSRKQTVSRSASGQEEKSERWEDDDNYFPDDMADEVKKDPASFFKHKPGSVSYALNQVVTAMKDPYNGVSVADRTYHFKRYLNVFIASDAVKWFIQNGYVSDETAAVELGNAIMNHGFIKHAVEAQKFANKKLFFKFVTSETIPSSSLIALAKRGSFSQSDPELAAGMLKLMYHVHENSVGEWLSGASATLLKLAYPVVLAWAQSQRQLSSMRPRFEALAEQDPGLKLALIAYCHCNNVEISEKLSIHAMPEEGRKTLMAVEDAPPGAHITKLSESKTLIAHPFLGVPVRVALEKEFTSAAKPAWVSFSSPNGKTVGFDAVAKSGDDLRKDLAVGVVFKAFESLWQAVPVKWQLGSPPFVKTYRVLVASSSAGYLEFVRGKTVKEVAANKEWSKVDVKYCAPSIVGALMAAFVLGVRDRHSDNLMLTGDPANTPCLMQIDFGYMFMENPGGLALDTPRLTLQPELVKVLKATPSDHSPKRSLMDDLQSDMLTAFMVLRKQSTQLVSFCKLALNSIYEPDQVESFMWGRHAFRLGMREEEVAAWLKKKLKDQLTEKYLRREAKQAIVKGYYRVKSVM